MPGPESTRFDESRYGMFVHANIATVPAFRARPRVRVAISEAREHDVVGGVTGA